MVEEKKKTFIKIYDSATEVEKAKIDVKKAKNEVEDAIHDLKKQQKFINYGMIAVIIVVALGFVTTVIATFTIFIDHQNYAAQLYDDYIQLLTKKEEQIKKETVGMQEIKTSNSDKINIEKQSGDIPPDKIQSTTN